MDRITIEQATRAPLETVWSACSELQGLRSWQADEVAGAVAPGALLELGWPALGVGIELRVELVEPGRRLVFQSDDSRLELELSPGRVQLSHEAAFDDEDEREGTRSSWKMALATLAHFVEEHAGHTREVHWSIERAPVSVETAHTFFTGAAAQTAWLTRTGRGTGVGEPGSEVALDLAWGSALTGRVLAHTEPRDALVSWRETNRSLLAFRTLPCPDGVAERLLAVTWSHWNLPDSARHAEQLDGALGRLRRVLSNRATA